MQNVARAQQPSKQTNLSRDSLIYKLHAHVGAWLLIYIYIRNPINNPVINVFVIC